MKGGDDGLDDEVAAGPMSAMKRASSGTAVEKPSDARVESEDTPTAGREERSARVDTFMKDVLTS